MAFPPTATTKSPQRPVIPPDAASLAADGRALADKPSLNHRFDMEAGVIGAMIAELGLTTYIDLGCWYGYLLRKVLARCSPTQVVAVEAIPGIMEFARGFVPEPRVQWINAAMIPASMAGTYGGVRVHPWDTSRSGLLAEEGTLIPDVPSCTIDSLLSGLGSDGVQGAYLKIDLEGIDDQIVVDLLDAGHRPAVIHFEVLPKDFQGSAAPAALRCAGYHVPALQKLGVHSLYSCVCARGQSKLIAFAPDAVYG
jgi:FkbM family methyltransferase